MKKEKPSLSNFYKLPNPGLWAYFKHNVSGNPEDYRPPFWNKMERSKVLQLWQDKLDALGVEKSYPELYAFEMDMKSKVGPMSIQLPLADRLESIEQYYTCVELPSEPISEDAIAATCAFFSKAGGIRCRSIDHVIENMRLSTNSGSPYFTKRKLIVENHDLAFPLRSHPLRNSAGFELCATLGWRGQEGGIEDDDVKQRVIWMMPFELNIIELQFYQPVIEAIQKNDLIPAYISMDRVDQEVTALFDTKGKDDDVICTDFTKFDQHFNKDMQNAAYRVEMSLMTKLKPSSDNELMSTLSWIALFKAKFNIPIVCSEDIMYTGEHGMGSGSGGTNFDECMAHKCLQFEAAQNAGQILNPHSMAYGDDGILTYPGIRVDDVVQTYTRHGQEMNATKQYVSKHDCVVLRRWHGMDYRVNGTMVGVYSTFRALGRLLAQERYYDPEKWSKELVILRALSILENCKWSPYFHEFIDFVISGDKYRLGLSIPGFFDKLGKLAQESIESFGDDFIGYTKSLQNPDLLTGINDWEVVKYLRSKL